MNLHCCRSFLKVLWLIFDDINIIGWCFLWIFSLSKYDKISFKMDYDMQDSGGTKKNTLSLGVGYMF